MANGFVRSAAAGNVAEVADLVAEMPMLANAAGSDPEWGGTPRAIQMAAERGHVAVVDALLDAGANPDAGAEGYGGWRALHLALAPFPAVALRLMSRGAEVDVWAAAMLGSIAQLYALARRDPGLITARGPNGAPPLHFASTIPMVQALIEAGADLKALDQFNRTAARSAAYDGKRRRLVAGFLVEITGENDVWIGAALGIEAMVRTHLNASPEQIDAVDGERLGPSSSPGPAALHVAVAVGELGVARLLLDRGADPNVRSLAGLTPLHYAAKHGYEALASLLLKRGADPSIHDTQYDATPYGWAEYFDQPGIVSLLGG